MMSRNKSERFAMLFFRTIMNAQLDQQKPILRDKTFLLILAAQAVLFVISVWSVSAPVDLMRNESDLIPYILNTSFRIMVIPSVVGLMACGATVLTRSIEMEESKEAWFAARASLFVSSLCVTIPLVLSAILVGIAIALIVFFIALIISLLSGGKTETFDVIMFIFPRKK